MLLIEYVGHKGLRSLTDGHLSRHLKYFKTLYDARVASVGFIKYNASTTRINKEKTLKSSSRSFWLSTGLIYYFYAGNYNHLLQRCFLKQTFIEFTVVLGIYWLHSSVLCGKIETNKACIYLSLGHITTQSFQVHPLCTRQS